MKPQPTSKRAKLKTAAKALNPFKSNGKQNGLNPSSTPSSASTLVLNVPGILDSTIQEEPPASIDAGSTLLSQVLNSDAARESDAQTSSSEDSTHPEGTISDDIVHDANIQLHISANQQESSAPTITDAEIHGVHLTTSSSAGRTAWNATRNIVDTVGQAADACPPLKSLVGGIMAILKTYDKIKGNKERSTSILRRLESLDFPESERSDPRELERRLKLSRALEPIHRDLSKIAEQSLLQRAANNVQDNDKVSSCVEDLRDALTDYQVSLQHDLQRLGRESISKVDSLLLAQLPRAKDARYSSGNHVKCLKGTRVDILEGIWAWAIDFNIARAYWLNGIAGSGKSTIAQTFAEWCFAEGLLGASFFCSRDSKERSDIKLIFPTIAFQLAERYPEFREALISTLGANADIGHASLTEQLEKLLLEPLRTTRLSTIIVIDALDECKDKEATSSILSVMGRIIHEIPSVRIFITGRPEPRVRSGFRLPLFQPYTEVFRLHEVRSQSVDEDIKKYLRVRLPDAIRNRSDIDISESWPDDKDISVLVQKCNGLFIFAATTYRFVSSAADDPRNLLQIVVDLADNTINEGLIALDAFYNSIMDAYTSPQRHNSQTLAQLQTILGAIVTAFNPLSRSVMATLLGITPNQIKTSLRHLHSVILVPESDSEPIKVYHKSFPDYLQDLDRCKHTAFYTDPKTHHGKMAIGCLRLLERELKHEMWKMPRDIQDLSTRRERFLDNTSEYACHFWAQHLLCCSGDGEVLDLVMPLLHRFFEQHLLSWIEALRMMGELRAVVYSLGFVQEWLSKVHHNDSDLLDWVTDAQRYILHQFDQIQEYGSFIYESSLLWLPSSSLVKKRYIEHRAIKVELSANAISPIWDRCTRTIRAGKAVNSVVFSDDGKLIAATGEAGDIWFLRVFEAATGTPVVTVERDDDELYSAAFSCDGSLVFAGSDNNNIMVWDLQTGGLIREYEGHTEWVRSVAVSPNGSSVASGSFDYDVRIWDIASGNCIYVLKGHTSWVRSVCWSPSGDRLISGSDDESVKVWDPATGLCLNTIKAHTSDIFSVAYSPDSSSFASGSWDETIKLHDSNTNAVLQTISAESRVNSVSFSPSSRHILYGTRQSSFIWDIEKQAIIAQFDQTHINCAAFSPTGTSMVSGSQGGVVRVWQVPGDAHDQLPDPSDHPAKSVVTQIVHSPNGELIVSGSGDGTIRILDAATNSCTHTFDDHTDAIQILAFSPDAALLVSGSRDSTIRVWDMREKRQIWVLEGHVNDIERVQFISNGTQLLSWSWYSIDLWDIETGEILAIMNRGGDFMNTDGVQVISDQDDSGSTRWVIQGYEFDDSSPMSELPVGFVPTQEKREMHDKLSKSRHQYRYLLEDGYILDQRHRTISWSAGERKWVWSDQDPSAGERFKVYYHSQGGGLNEKWVVDREGRRILWMPQDRRGPSSNWGKKLQIALEDGRVITLDFTDVQS